MHVCGQGTRLAFQPESQRERLVLYRLFSEVPDSWFTFDVSEYPDLDDRLDGVQSTLGTPTPGARALILPEVPKIPTAEDEP